ncbi:hypothetical protein GCM10028784_34920 [Myceligenerans cantabricum]
MTRIAPRTGSSAYVVCVGLPADAVAQVVEALGGRHAVLVVPDGDSAVNLLAPDRPADYRPTPSPGPGSYPAPVHTGRVVAFPRRDRYGQDPATAHAEPFAEEAPPASFSGAAQTSGGPPTNQIPAVTGGIPTVSGAFPAVPPAQQDPIVHGPLTLDRAAREVQVQGREVHLSAQEFDLLATLASQADRVWTFAELTAHVWGTRYLGDADAVTSAIKRLRRRLPRMRGLEVASVRGVGYRLRVPD